MDDLTSRPEPSTGAGYAFVGVLALLLAAGLLGAASDESAFLLGGVAAAASGCYLLIAGGVARGIQLARRPERARPDEPARTRGPQI